jgi:integrase/recombinase XerD
MPMLAAEISTESHCSAILQAPHEDRADRTLLTVKVYTRHNRNCPKRGRSDWARCNCVKWLYIYRDGKYKLVSAKTRSWERAEQRAREIRDSFDPVKQMQRQLEAKSEDRKSQLDIAIAVEQFLEEVARLNRAEATRAKYRLTLNRLLNWCARQEVPVTFMSQLDVATTRRWIHSWAGAPTTLHNQHQRVIAFFNFCIEQGWIKENPAKKIKKVPRKQEETLPFTRQQFDALVEATYYYDGRANERNGKTTNSRRVRAYLKLLRWSGLRAGDAACLPKSNLRPDDSLFLYQAKVKGKTSAAVYVLLPPDVADELRKVPRSSVTHPNYFFWSGRSKRKSEVSNWEKIFAKIMCKARELFPRLFTESSGEPKRAHLHMLRDTFAVEYLLAGMPLDEVSRLLGHSSVTITQKHYAPWVLERQQRLAANQRAAWTNMGVKAKRDNGSARNRSSGLKKANGRSATGSSRVPARRTSLSESFPSASAMEGVSP